MSEQSLEEPWQASPFYNLSVGKITNLPRSADIEAFKEERTGDLELGRILASAIHFGALLNRDHWNPWLRSIRRMTWWDNLHWIPFKTQIPGERPQRWFADPFTAHLIKKWRKNTERANIIADADDALAAFLAKAYGGRQSLDAFYARARLRWHMRLPAVLVDKALGRLPSVPLSEVRWRKSIGHPRFLEGSEKSGFTSFAPLEIHEIRKAWLRRSKDIWPEEHLVFDTSEKHYRCGSIPHSRWKSLTAELLERIADRRSKTLPNWDYRILIPSWLAYRMREKRADEKRGFSPRLMREQLAAISMLLGKRWNGVAVGRNVQHKSLTLKMLARMHGSVSTNNDSAKLLFAEAVADLRSFMKDRKNSRRPPPDYSKTKVSASVVTPRIYRKCLSFALRSTPPGWHVDRPFPPTQIELTVATILAFRAGLRMREILGLLVGDFIISGAIFELHLNENDMRPLKTRKSRRILPLDVLVPDAEKTFLLKWLEGRRSLVNLIGQNGNCFGPPSHRGIIDSGPYFQAFEKLFRDADEPFLGFRHFRHSFSSYLLTNLTLPSAHAIRCIPAQFRSDINWRRRSDLSRRFLGEERIGQSALHAVSQSMGHTGIYRTLESYQHLLDLTLGLYVNDACVMDNDGRDLLYKAKLVYPRHAEERKPSRLRDAEMSTYSAPNKAESRLSSRPAVLKKTPNEYAAETTERGLGKERREYDAEVMRASVGSFPEPIDWTVVRHVMKSREEATLTETLATLRVSEEDAKAWRDFDEKWSERWSNPKSPKQYSPEYFGAQGIFYLNRLWTGYHHHPPSELVKEAISNFVAGYDRKNMGAKMGTIERCLALEDYLISLGLSTNDFDYNDEQYELARWQKSSPLGCKLQFGRTRRVCLREGKPRLRLRKGAEFDAMGLSSDAARATRPAPDKGKKKSKKIVASPDHKHVTAAMYFFIYLVAAKEKITPNSLDARSTAWKNECDFEIRGTQRKWVAWRTPRASQDPISKV